jgi:hypothetical protein
MASIACNCGDRYIRDYGQSRNKYHPLNPLQLPDLVEISYDAERRAITLDGGCQSIMQVT